MEVPCNETCRAMRGMNAAEETRAATERWEDAMAGTVTERNAAGLARLRAVAGRLSDADLERGLEGGWTVGVAFAHIAFWDTYLVARWEQAAVDGHGFPPETPDGILDLVNAAALAGWQAVPPRQAAALALAAAERAERFVAGLDADATTQAIAAGRQSLVDRTLHWGQHLDQIEAALHTR
jgi:hypothetical protein